MLRLSICSCLLCIVFHVCTGQDAFQDDILGCDPAAHPPCPLQTAAPHYYKKEETVYIPYVIDPEIDDASVETITAAVDSVSQQTGCLQFVPVEDAHRRGIPRKPLIRFAHDDRCAAQFDPAANPVHKVYLTTDCVATGKTGRIQELLLLAMGFPREIDRHDRDDYVVINWENIDEARKPELYKNEAGVFDALPYDFASLLHPGYNFLMRSKKAPSILPKTRIVVGLQEKLSAGDITKLKKTVCEGTPGTPSNKRMAIKPRPTPTTKPTTTTAPTTTDEPVTTEEPAPTDAPASGCGSGCEENPSAVEIVTPSMSLPLKQCRRGQPVTVINRQTMSRTFIYPPRTQFRAQSRTSSWWFGQNADMATRDHLAKSVDYDDFKGVVSTVKTIQADESTRVFQTKYEPSMMPDGGELRQTKEEMRIMQCAG
ncbi:zinc metalloproteinase nas-14-like [Paramacrobiotus metropolitanus]|uniref:zinc metalloproteinase nas-14-like n=1 Tax=Paramacrobiotus metropolitanus TaxID=2943436 RepID=UPI0024464DB8|nr:zinc metalloproteinase nas-14-like [Paramacrobiotus metropolitanus]